MLPIQSYPPPPGYVLAEMPQGHPGARRVHILVLQEWQEPPLVRAEASVWRWPWPPGCLLSRLLLGWALPRPLAKRWCYLQVGMGSLDVIPVVAEMADTAPSRRPAVSSAGGTGFLKRKRRGEWCFCSYPWYELSNIL